MEEFTEWCGGSYTPKKVRGYVTQYQARVVRTQWGYLGLANHNLACENIPAVVQGYLFEQVFLAPSEL